MRKRQFLLGGLTAIVGIFRGKGSTMAQANDPVDVAALAALRPGMPMSRLAEAMGASWRAPAPHKGGFVDVLENSHGIVVRLDRNDLIGWVKYDWRFNDADIEGIRIGMSLADARVAMPDLAIGDDQTMMSGVRDGQRDLPDGARMLVTFTLETVNGIEFFILDADFHEPSMPPYAEPHGEAGAPFSDVNFKLVVLSSLLDAKAIDLGTPENLATHVLGRPVDLEEEGYDLIPEVVDYLARYPLSSDLLAQVRSIAFDGGNAIYRFPWYFWDGEDNTFDISNIAGVGLCPNVTSVEAISMMSVDIRELTSLTRLEELSIGTDYENFDAIRDLPALKRLYIIDNEIHAQSRISGHPTKALLDELKARGVSIQINPLSF